MFSVHSKNKNVTCDTFNHSLGCLNLSFAYVEGESLLMALKDVALSSGRSVITPIMMGYERCVTLTVL